jgi:hypothetical protein
MRAASDRARSIIGAGGVNFQWVFDLMYDGERRLPNVPIENTPALQWDGGQFVTGSGRINVIWSDAHARSMIPRAVGDWFSPFGAEIQADVLIGGGVFTERIPQGRFVLTDVPDVVESNMPWDGRTIHPGEQFSLQVKDPLARVQRDDFLLPTTPRTTSVWAEIQDVSSMTIVRTVADAPVPTIPYEGAKEPILKQLFDVLDAWPHVDASGALTARPKTWPAPIADLVNVVAAPPSMTSQYTYNRVAVIGKSPAGVPLYGIQEVAGGFLRARNRDGSPSPFRTATYTYRSDRLTTQQQVNDYATSLLPRVSRLRSVTRKITEPFNPLREVGDVLTFRGGLVRVVAVSHSGGFTVLTVEVPDE